MKLYVLPYKSGSASAKTLAEQLNTKRIKLTGSRFRPSPTKAVLNWGNSTSTDLELGQNVLNKYTSVGLASNKLHFFRKLSEERSHCLNGLYGNDAVTPVFPDWTADIAVAQSWLEEGHCVVERHKLTGNSGEGIRIVGEGEEDELTPAPLYTKYFKKKAEFRVHIVGSEVILTQKKVKRADVAAEEVNWKVRNHDGGFIFQQNGIEVPIKVLSQAKLAIHFTNLDFGAVDIMYNEREDEARILEVNTAPGLAGTTCEKYARALQRYANIKFG